MALVAPGHIGPVRDGRQGLRDSWRGRAGLSGPWPRSSLSCPMSGVCGRARSARGLSWGLRVPSDLGPWPSRPLAGPHRPLGSLAPFFSVLPHVGGLRAGALDAWPRVGPAGSFGLGSMALSATGWAPSWASPASRVPGPRSSLPSPMSGVCGQARSARGLAWGLRVPSDLGPWPSRPLAGPHRPLGSLAPFFSVLPHVGGLRAGALDAWPRVGPAGSFGLGSMALSATGWAPSWASPASRVPGPRSSLPSPMSGVCGQARSARCLAWGLRVPSDLGPRPS